MLVFDVGNPRVGKAMMPKTNSELKEMLWRWVILKQAEKLHG